jgi:hypothetical protein
MTGLLARRAFIVRACSSPHVLVGAVGMGTDGWIQNITGNILTTSEGKILFVFTSLLMFLLRFCAHFIEKSLKISPVGLLLICSMLASSGLNLVSGIATFAGAVAALSVTRSARRFSGRRCWRSPVIAFHARAPSPSRSWRLRHDVRGLLDPPVSVMPRIDSPRRN